MALVSVLSLGAAACNHVEAMTFAPAPAPAAPPSTATAVTLRNGTGISLAVVPGSPTTTAVQVAGGGAAITGTVIGPLGPLPGATVSAERVVNTASGSITAVTGPDGSFSLQGLRGGNYRVRAWEPPGLAMTASIIFFLDDATIQPLTLTLSSFNAVAAVGVVNPDPPVVGQPANLAVQVTMAVVGPDGVVRHPVLPAATVVLTNDPTWGVATTPGLVTTGTNGEAVFTVTCAAPGVQPIDVSINGQMPIGLQLAPCRVPPTTTTAPPPTTAATTTTTAPKVPGATTTTSAVTFP